MSNYNLDSHKLFYHPGRVENWLKNGDEYPIFAEIGLAGGCNHRCVFCCVDSMGYESSFLDTGNLLDNIKRLCDKGLKSVLLAGDGEPTLHPDFIEIVCKIKKMGIDIAMLSNGVLFDKEKIDATLSNFTWIRFSISGYENYEKIHKANSGDFDKVIENLTYAVEQKKKNRLKTTLGVQVVLIPENIEDAYKLGLKAKELGLDYISIKACGASKNMLNDSYKKIKPEEFFKNQTWLEEKIKDINCENFNALYRKNRIDALIEDRIYNECYGGSFYLCIDSHGNVNQCCTLMDSPQFHFGNIYEENIIDVWNGEKRKNIINLLKKNNLSQCPKGCRLHEINNYLYRLKNPPEHVNFI